MIALILRFSLPKGEEILHIQSILCRKYLYESRFYSTLDALEQAFWSCFIS